MSLNPHAHYLSELYHEDPDELRRYIRKALHDNAGSPTAAARALGCSRPNIWYWLRRLGMQQEPALYRERAKKRFRLGPNTA